MSQTITLTLPDRLFEPIQRMAQATDQPVEAVLLTALQTSLPSLDGLPEHLIAALVDLEAMDNLELQHVLLEMVPAEEQRDLNDLLQRNQAGTLSESEREQLTLLQASADPRPAQRCCCASAASASRRWRSGMFGTRKTRTPRRKTRTRSRERAKEA